MSSQLTLRLLLAVGLGLLVGLERQRREDPLAGIRTFALLALAGFLCGVLAETYGVALVPVGLGGVVATTLAANYLYRASAQEIDPGMTTEVAVILTYLVGVALAADQTTLGVVTGGALLFLLHSKSLFHGLVDRLGPAEFQGLVRLVLLGLVILPVLPDQGYGPYQVMNPFKAWLMVVLIVGISLGAHLAQRMLGARAGVVLAGILGGLISSTATTAGYARRSAQAPATSAAASLVVLLASTVLLGRVAVEIGVVAPARFGELAPPILAAGAWMVLLCLGALYASHGELTPEEEQDPPSPFGTAVAFGLLYILVLLASSAAKEYLGTQGVYAVAVVSGLTDVDAITLSAVEMLQQGLLEPATTWRVVLVATLSNLAFKFASVWALGSPAMTRRVALLFGLGGLGGVAVLVLW